MYIGVFDVYLVLWGPHLGACVGFLSDPSPIIGYACQWLTHSVTPWRLVDLMAVNDANCLVVTVADADAEDNVGNSLLQIWDVICVWTCDMTSRGYFGKMNSTLGSVVPLAMFWNTSLTDKARHKL